MKRTLGCLAVIAFLVTCIALASVLITPHYPQADSGQPAYTFDSEEELHDYVQDYIEEHYAADHDDIEAEYNQAYYTGYEHGRDAGYSEGYGEGYGNGYYDGYNDCAAGVPYEDQGPPV